MPERKFEEIADNVCSGIISSRQRKIARNELLDHLKCETEDAVSRGLSESDAVAQVIGNFGSEADVKKELTASYKTDNFLAIIEGALSFIGYTVIAGLILFLQMIIIFFSFVTDSYLYISCIHFILLGVISFASARRRAIKPALFTIPCALSQLLWTAWLGEEMPTFIIAVPELIKGNLIGFLKDLQYYEILPTRLSVALMILFIAAFVIHNIAIAVSSFKLKAKRTDNVKPLKIEKYISAGMLIFTIFSLLLCCVVFLLPDVFTTSDYIEEYYILPANDQTEIENIMRYYSETAEKEGTDAARVGYATEEVMYKVYYHHDLDSAVIYIHSYINGKEKIPKNIDSEWLKENGYEDDPDFIAIYDLTYDDTPEVYGDKTIKSVSSWEETKRDSFYKTGTSRVIIEPDKHSGYFVLIPFINDKIRTDRAEIIELPLENNVEIHGNMHYNTYEILLRKPTEQ